MLFHCFLTRIHRVTTRFRFQCPFLLFFFFLFQNTRSSLIFFFRFSFCYGTDFVVTASAVYFFYFGVELQHSAVAGSQLSLLCRRLQPTTL